MIKRLILIALIAIVSVQLVLAPNNVPSEPISAKLSFGNVELPTGTVTGYNLTMQDDALLSVLGVETKAVYFIVADEPAFYRKTAENNIQLFEVPFNAETNLIETAVTEDASQVVINRLPYKFAYSDRLGFSLNLNYDGSLYGILFGRQRSNNAITIDGVSGKALFLYNDNSGNIALLENDELSSLGLSTPKTVTFRAPRADGGERNEGAEARRIERAGAIAEGVEGEGCTDVDAGTNEYSTSSYGYDESGIFLSDFCATDPRVGRKVLNEVKCNAEGNAYLEEHECTGVCRNGACTATEGGQVAFCYDSDMAGINGAENIAVVRPDLLAEVFASKGIVAGFYAAGRDITYGLWDDSCATENRLVEYYCGNSKTRFITAVCGSGCSEGKCATPPYCIDIDGGENERIKSKTIAITSSQVGGSATNEDVCIDNSQLREYSCDTTGLQKDLTISCEFGCFDGRCLKEGEITREPCTTKNDCAFSQGCVNGFCDKCTKSQDCGSGWVCSSPDKRCKPASGRCQTDTNCKIGKYCKPKEGQLGFCENERLSTLTDISNALARRWKRINVYARVIASSEELHSLPLPQRVANEQACLVDNQCLSNECSPQTGKCTGTEPNPDEFDPNTPNAPTPEDITAANYATDFSDIGASYGF